MQPFTLSQDADGARHAASPELAITVLPDGESKMFHRNAIKKNSASGEAVHLRALVAELNGVRVYIMDGHMIITTQDLYL
ncbi:MAG: hypothetical protein KGJ21_00665 [Pseudomonadota bacterium]|nr:hypothetical protein [Pseudomonadota bacterium]